MLDTLNIFNSLSGSVISWQNILFSLIMAFILGAIIALVYLKSNIGSSEKSFGFTLVLLTVIIAAIMITIGSNVALSLGLVGSLSIIRFRTAIKSSIDMAFLFWTIAEGLAIGAGQYPIAIIVLLVTSIIVYSMSKTTFFSKSNFDYIFVISINASDATDDIETLMTRNNINWKLKSKFIEKDAGEITYSVFSKKSVDFNKLTSTINKLKSVNNISVLSPETNLFV